MHTPGGPRPDRDIGEKIITDLKEHREDTLFLKNQIFIGLFKSNHGK